jgi:phosphate transport system substrate-binding protein
MNRENIRTSFLILLGCSIFLISCNTNNKKDRAKQGITNGEATILADESLFPIVDDEYQVFSNNYKTAKINILYKPQQELLNLFLTDSIDVAIMPRTLTKEESRIYEKKEIIIRTTKFAIDGVALITGKENQDSVISVEDLIKSLKGEMKTNINFVFDNPKSSTVEYLMSLSGVKKFPQNIYALSTNKDVIRYISKHPNAIGVVSVAWMKRPTPDIIKEVGEIKIMGISEKGGAFEKPSQSNLKMGNYPLIRDLYLINCQGRAGLGTGFAAFLAGEIGQRIILKSGLAPDSLPSRQIFFRK